jgi:AcrR family transcriptional regulator
MLYGVRAVTMDDIARNGGISKKTIYEEFTSKEELVNGVFESAMRQDECVFQEMVEKEESAIDHLIRMTKYLRGRFAKMNPLVLHDIQRYYPQCWKRLEQFKREHALKGIAGILERGKKSGDFRPEINSEILAHMRLEQVTNSFLGNFPSDGYSLLDFQLQVLDHFIHGLLTDQGRATYYQKLKKSGAIT